MLCQMSKYFGKCFGPSTRAPKFLTQMPELFIIKIWFTIKVNLWCGSGYLESVSQVQFSGSCSQDCGSQGRNFQVPETHIQGPGCQGSKILCLRVPGLRSQGPRVPGPSSQVLILDYALFLFIKGEFSYIKWEQNYISKLHSMMTQILMSWFKESTERQKN